jgi:hypothetical protein
VTFLNDDVAKLNSPIPIFLATSMDCFTESSSTNDIHQMMDNLKKYNIFEDNRLNKNADPYIIYQLNFNENELLFQGKHILIINTI